MRSCLIGFEDDAGASHDVMVTVERNAQGVRAIDFTWPGIELLTGEAVVPDCVEDAVRRHRGPARSYGIEFVRDREGHPIVIVETRDGVRDGYFCVLRADGVPSVMDAYRDDLEHGIWVWLDPEGRAVRASAFILGLEIPMGIRHAPW